MRRAVIIMIGMLAFPVSAFAYCAPTARLAPSNYPGAAAIQNSNDLLQTAGKSVAASGQKLVILGRLLDSRCLPVPDASVEIWQVDPYGHWLLAEADDLAAPNAVFAGAGRTYTNGDGQFMFTTAFPAALAKRAPTLNIRIHTPEATLTTTLFFAGDRHNPGDPVYQRLNPVERDSVTLRMGRAEQPDSASGDLAGNITLVLPVPAGHQTY